MSSTQLSSDDKQKGYVDNPLGYVNKKNERQMFLDWSGTDLEKLRDEMPNLYQAIVSVDKIHEILLNDVKTITVNAFKDELLPMLMSEDPEIIKLGIDYFERVACGPHRPLDIVNEYNEVIIRAPGARSNIQTQQNDVTSTITSYMAAAFRRDQMLGNGKTPNTDNVLENIFNSDNDTFDYNFLIGWDAVLMTFGYPSYFTELERQYLGLPEIYLYPGCTPVILPHPIVPEGKVSARAKVRESARPGFSSSTVDGDDFFEEDDDTEWGD